MFRRTRTFLRQLTGNEADRRLYPRHEADIETRCQALGAPAQALEGPRPLPPSPDCDAFREVRILLTANAGQRTKPAAGLCPDRGWPEPCLSPLYHQLEGGAAHALPDHEQPLAHGITRRERTVDQHHQGAIIGHRGRQPGDCGEPVLQRHGQGPRNRADSPRRGRHEGE